MSMHREQAATYGVEVVDGSMKITYGLRSRWNISKRRRTNVMNKFVVLMAAFAALFTVACGGASGSKGSEDRSAFEKLEALEGELAATP